MPFDPVSFAIGAKAGAEGGGGDISVVSKSISANGTYTAPSGKAYSPVTVNVPASAVDSGTKSITSNGTDQDVVGYAAVDVAVPNSYAAGDEGKVVSNGELVAQTSDSVTQNGTVDTTLINSLTVNVSGGGASVDRGTFTPASTTLTATLTVTRTIVGLTIIAESNPYGISGGRTFAALTYDSNGSAKGATVSSNASGSSEVGAYSTTSWTISQSGNTVTVTTKNGAGSGYFISGITYRWIAW